MANIPKVMPKGGFEQHLQQPTSFPDEPVTMGNTDWQEADNTDMESLREWVPFLEHVASRPGATPELIDLAQRAKNWFS